ncbi:MAG: hypothetical protein KGZ25_00075 [Planctomycetes bacterium]|nr:hypothetical protein [Planctomycetota bacterium]
MNRHLQWLLLIVAVFLATTQSASARTLKVGPGRPFSRIEKASAAARPGDVILVYPRKNNAPYKKTAVFDRGFSPPNKTSLSPKQNSFGRHKKSPFVNPADDNYRPVSPFKTSIPARRIKLPPYPDGDKEPEPPLAWQYVHPARKRRRTDRNRPVLGAMQPRQRP